MYINVGIFMAVQNTWFEHLVGKFSDIVLKVTVANITFPAIIEAFKQRKHTSVLTSKKCKEIFAHLSHFSSATHLW